MAAAGKYLTDWPIRQDRFGEGETSFGLAWNGDHHSWELTNLVS